MTDGIFGKPYDRMAVLKMNLREYEPQFIMQT